jgi:hypothetical protein
LPALETEHQHGAGVEVMQSDEIFSGESLVKFATEVAVFVVDLGFFIFRHFNELIFNSLYLVFVF